MSAEESLEPQGRQRQTYEGQVQARRAKAAAVKADTFEDVEVGICVGPEMDGSKSDGDWLWLDDDGIGVWSSVKGDCEQLDVSGNGGMLVRVEILVA